ncbi:FAD-dependent oxidoreductase [Roseimaritima ulvae]|uniref:FAD-dependent oxidoreductase n=1 Tax=Roseimaritima ulvae TaxID=980254 RepID=UPI0036F31650
MGILSLISARMLADHGWNVTVYEKSPGVGGRLSTRRVNGHTEFCSPGSITAPPAIRG